MSNIAPMAQAIATPRQSTASVLAFPTPKAAMPDAETAWRAVQARDRAFNGRFFFSVKSTGVYCLPSCAARPPLRKNVDFHGSCEAAEAAGFRACKRCRPRDWQAEAGLSRAVAQACKLLDTETDDRPSLERIARQVGLTGSTLTRRFQRELGVAPRDWLAARKTSRFKAALKAGDNVTSALYGAGYGSSSRVYEKSDQVLGMTPATYRKGGAGARIAWTTVAAGDYGRVLVAATAKGIAAVRLGDDEKALLADLREDFPAAEIVPDDGALSPKVKAVLARLDGNKPTAIDAPDMPLDIVGTAFQWRVWKALSEIPAGATATYGEIARRIGEPGAARAVGRACATNPVALVVPCHRAVGSSGALTGYRWGVERKKRILAAEKQRAVG